MPTRVYAIRVLQRRSQDVREASVNTGASRTSLRTVSSQGGSGVQSSLVSTTGGVFPLVASSDSFESSIFRRMANCNLCSRLGGAIDRIVGSINQGVISRATLGLSEGDRRALTSTFNEQTKRR